ncbi:hypothetical protein CWI39_2154p0010 [Hamiltosporidium magnivora]|uniref:Uncharacterized protein n=1 Tax=Hamiltosporidium magnivora TaxID=148818 RepID=A0A4Q9KXZ3_9MICR|nr:hypothetical protein CWI39_2154p0010 [Hamiltosporidium magnivora]
MGIRKKNSAGEILMCDVDVAMLSERLPPPPTFHDTTHQPPSSSCQTSPFCLVDTIPSSSGTDATAFGPANGIKPQYRCHSRRESTDGIALNT